MSKGTQDLEGDDLDIYNAIVSHFSNNISDQILEMSLENQGSSRLKNAIK